MEVTQQSYNLLEGTQPPVVYTITICPRVHWKSNDYTYFFNMFTMCLKNDKIYSFVYPYLLNLSLIQQQNIKTWHSAMARLIRINIPCKRKLEHKLFSIHYKIYKINIQRPFGLFQRVPGQLCLPGLDLLNFQPEGKILLVTESQVVDHHVPSSLQWLSQRCSTSPL